MNEGIFSIVCSAYDKFLVIYLNFPCLSVAIRKKFIHARKAKQMFLISEFVFRFFRLKAWLEVMSCSAVIFLKKAWKLLFFHVIWDCLLHLTNDSPKSPKYFIHAHTKTFAILHVHVFQSVASSEKEISQAGLCEKFLLVMRPTNPWTLISLSFARLHWHRGRHVFLLPEYKFFPSVFASRRVHFVKPRDQR